MSQLSFLRIASALPADTFLADFEPFKSVGSGTYGVSTPSVQGRTGQQIAEQLRPLFHKKKTCGYCSVSSVKAVFFDMDSTVVAEETIVELARFAGKEKPVAEITERAMRGELDFSAALAARVATLAGLSTDILTTVAAHMTLNKGIKEFAAYCKASGIPIFLVSGGFMEVAEPFRHTVGFDDIRANRLGAKNGILTGETVGPVIDGAAKLAFVKETCARLGISPKEAATVGDGANDLPMMQASGVAVGFCPRPVLLDHVQAVIADGDHRFLAPLLFGSGI